MPLSAIKIQTITNNALLKTIKNNLLKTLVGVIHVTTVDHFSPRVKYKLQQTHLQTDDRE